ncbi:competence protein CoiA [Bacillus sp. UNCCL13]|uniref:competence protein CoiA n=1 Tax=Bacillus sp. UNCCL13 TaxID=1502772 RepID=UPI001C31D300|nr:competence protein CoiA family protein [Bacillus sp. UNCCL13]
MLTAVTDGGLEVCLADANDKLKLLSYRREEHFLCPSCKQRVIMKLGDKRIYHFAHIGGSSCPHTYERESLYHLEGKKQLYLWLKKEGYCPILEQYDPEIQQRPDITFIKDGKKYAVEYQCSSIAADLFKKRTKAYISQNYHPLWILGGNHFKRKGENTISLSGFDFLFYKTEEFIPYYCSKQNKFILATDIHPISPQKAYANFTFIQPENTPVDLLLKPKKKIPVNLRAWCKLLQKVRLNMCKYHTQREGRFLKTLYHNRLNPFLLPPIVGIPIQSSVIIETSPLIWQAYVFLDSIHNKKLGQTIYTRDVIGAFFRRCNLKEILIREIPSLCGSKVDQAVNDYLEVLTELGILKKTSESTFLLMVKVEIPQTTLEQQEMEASLYQLLDTISKTNNKSTFRT